MTKSDTDLTTLELDELVRLEEELSSELKEVQAEKRRRVRTAAQKLAETAGISLDELVREASPRRASGPKYQHPDDPARTWSGRGRQPKWLGELLAQGMTLDDLRITE